MMPDVEREQPILEELRDALNRGWCRHAVPEDGFCNSCEARWVREIDTERSARRAVEQQREAAANEALVLSERALSAEQTLGNVQIMYQLCIDERLSLAQRLAELERTVATLHHTCGYYEDEIRKLQRDVQVLSRLQSQIGRAQASEIRTFYVLSRPAVVYFHDSTGEHKHQFPAGEILLAYAVSPQEPSDG